MIDVIIPAYKAHNTIDLTLSSILIQTFVDKIKVTIVNDNPEDDYKSFIEKYSKFFKIEEIKMKENGGPGFARQLGIKKTKEKYLTFIDADDIFCDSLAIQKMIEILETNENAIMASCTFLEQFQDDTFLRHDNDIVWMFGKIYRRKFIKENNIHFINSWANEDLGFNLQIKINLKEKEYIHWFNEAIYLWRYKEDSITRINDGDYTYHKSILGVIENKLRILKEADINNSTVRIEIVSGLIDFYFSLQNTQIYRSNKPEYADDIFNEIVNYYKEIGKEAFSKTSEKEFIEIFHLRGNLNKHFIVKYTFNDFIRVIEDKLKEEETND